MQGYKSMLAALAAVLVTVGGVWWAQRTVPPRQATWEDVQAEARAGGYRLIATEELAQRFRQDPAGMLLVDTR